MRMSAKKAGEEGRYALRAWMEENDMHGYELAEKLDLTPSWVSKMLYGFIEPSLTKAAEIEELTGGKVKATSLIKPAKPLPQRLRGESYFRAAS